MGSEQFWIAPVSSSDEGTANEILEQLVSKKGVWGFRRESTASRMREGDGICFYCKRIGIASDAKVGATATFDPLGISKAFPWVIKLVDVSYYPNTPVSLSQELFAKLDAFQGKATKTWSWYVQTTHTVTKHDFELLTKRKLTYEQA